MKKLLLGMFVASTLALTGCQSTEQASQYQEEMAVATIIGTVSYRERIALPDDAQITVTLQDISLADAPSVEIARTEFESQGFQSPFAFQLDYDPAQIVDGHTYSVSARIEVGGKLRFITDTVYQVITDRNETDQVNLRLIGVGGRS